MTSLTRRVKIRLEELEAATYTVSALWLGDRCPLWDGMDAIREKHERLYYTTLRVLDTHLPHRGPHFYRRDAATVKDISHWGIREIQFGGHPAPAVRVLWFYGDEDKPQPRNIVCVDAFWKMEGESSGEIFAGDRVPAAAKVRELYFEAEARGELSFEDDEGGAW